MDWTPFWMSPVIQPRTWSPTEEGASLKWSYVVSSTRRLASRQSATSTRGDERTAATSGEAEAEAGGTRANGISLTNVWMSRFDEYLNVVVNVQLNVNHSI